MVVGTLPLNASATPADTPDVSTTAIRNQLSDAGVSAATQTNLVQKLKNGVPWDSMIAAKPISTETNIEGNFSVVTSHFADGSVSKMGTEIPQLATDAELAQMIAAAKRFVPAASATTAATATTGPHAIAPVTNGVAPMAAGVRLCKYGYSAGVAYNTNCQVYYDGVSWSSSFRANYEQWAGGSAAHYVNATRNTVAFTLTVSDEQILTLDSGTRIRYALNLHPAGWGNIPFKLDLKVTPSQAYAQLP
jgi:hypothetical protein